jgi:hypothetical protein
MGDCSECRYVSIGLARATKCFGCLEIENKALCDDLTYQQIISNAAQKKLIALEAEIEALREAGLKIEANAMSQFTELEVAEAENQRLSRENRYMKQYLKRQAAGAPCPDTASSILAALEVDKPCGKLMGGSRKPQGE